jgi:hypothetical protein
VNTTSSSDSNPASAPLEVLSNLQKELAAAVNSVAGRLPTTICDRYHLNAGGYINRAVEGYCCCAELANRFV